MKEISLTMENRNFDNGLNEKLAKNWRHHEKNSTFELQILFRNFLENFSSIWSFLGQLWKKLEHKQKFAHFPKILIENSLIIQECG